MILLSKTNTISNVQAFTFPLLRVFAFSKVLIRSSCKNSFEEHHVKQFKFQDLNFPSNFKGENDTIKAKVKESEIGFVRWLQCTITSDISNIVGLLL